jgi:hypothetical protein
MQICEYYQAKSICCFEAFEGRWHYEVQEELLDNGFWWTTFKWTDLFGKEKQM